MAYRIALFDFDGVLADSAAWFADQLPELARRHRFRAPDAAEIERLRKLPTREVVKALGVSPLRLPGIAAGLRNRMASDADQIQLFDGVRPMLQRLQDRGTRIAIVSSNGEPNVRAVLGASASLVSAFSCGASLFGKGHRFTSLLRKLEIEPARACAVGDEVRDIDAAHRAGIASVAVSWGYGAAETLSGALPDSVATTPAEVGDLLLA
ncbi:HAD hydrolase-like protein [Brevundimonas sp. PAMC22021]|uniref:HAD hydrolase-like protein n=1 Tax=Brevundimonas sp. PAMC22021 TaxID=2861285 RepID=UPI001C62E796|nr:HAD hydrolase-like protein [Brevundimonas sp. PAMC22021]QYF86994.1 HAD hydrolase-like protein [Brevundimonas sp. PAMC22021]